MPDFTKTELTVAELYEITIQDGSVAYFTSHDKDLVYGGNTYQAIPIKRTRVNYHTDLQVDKVDITLGLIGIQVGTKNMSIPEVIRRGYLRNAHVKIRAVDYEALADDKLLFEGWASGEVTYNGGMLQVSVGSILDKLSDKFPKLVYSETCNHNLFSISNQPTKYTLCELDSALWLVSGTVIMPITFTGAGLDDMATSGSYGKTGSLSYQIVIDATGTPDTFKWSNNGGVTFQATGVAITGVAQLLENGIYVTFPATTGHTLADLWDFKVGSRQIIYADVFDWALNPTYTEGWWEKGKLQPTSGNNDTVIRSVVKHSQGYVKLMIPLPEDLVVGDTFSAYPGCDKTGKTCDEKFSNYTHFLGFEYIPSPDTFFGL